MTPLDKLRAALTPAPPPEYGWGAGSQADALKHYLPTVKVHAVYQQPDYQGSVAALVQLGRDWFLWRDSFGSCSGCDALEGSDGLEYIRRTLTAGMVKDFRSKEQAVSFLKTPVEGWDDWSDVRQGLLSEIEADVKPRNPDLGLTKSAPEGGAR